MFMKTQPLASNLEVRHSFHPRGMSSLAPPKIQIKACSGAGTRRGENNLWFVALDDFRHHVRLAVAAVAVAKQAVGFRIAHDFQFDRIELQGAAQAVRHIAQV